jgi:hypothetical protein
MTVAVPVTLHGPTASHHDETTFTYFVVVEPSSRRVVV